ncbi:FadR/GntR family transcriptional regulator [Aliirhizobium smilacinae]|uniref:FadR family transcriptional regulator n=1 Tax=Aliirhizobium smilacinae TaxID=1395944 RepID=A0A5C4XJS4_9HYPH|nr:FCD domain-containing protein [Rhizobium smilacinae]TNM63558.1 FadR family transcriptional regulator [Rhizobium smilacinae]
MMRANKSETVATRLEDNSPTRMFAPIRVHRTFEAVVERIVDAIDAQGLRQGDRLPNESEMAKMLEISRPTLRQAFRILENSGVLQIKAGQSGGVFVAADIIPFDVVGKNIASEVMHIEEVISSRRLLEPLVYHLAAENATEQQFAQIQETIELVRHHRHDPRIVQQADGMFHRRVAHACGNQMLLSTMTTIYRQLAPLRGALRRDADRADHIIDVHTRQLEAMRRKDHAGLESILDETFIDLEEEYGVKRKFSIRWHSGE